MVRGKSKTRPTALELLPDDCSAGEEKRKLSGSRKSKGEEGYLRGGEKRRGRQTGSASREPLPTDSAIK